MKKHLQQITFACLLGAAIQHGLPAAPPGQAYHRTPVCADGNCVPNRSVGGFNATRWRPWPEGESSQNVRIPPVGIDLRKTEPPSSEKELELPVRPAAPGDEVLPGTSPNDRPGGAIAPPNEFQDVTPRRPMEQPLPGNSSLQRGPLFPTMRPAPDVQPFLLGNKVPPVQTVPAATPSNNLPREEQPAILKIRPAGNSRVGLTPEMVPWNDEEKNPIVRQTARITGTQVQQTISLDEGTLPDAADVKPLTIRIQEQSAPSRPIQTVAIAAAPNQAMSLSVPSAYEPEVRSAANAPAILPPVEARPLPMPQHTETISNAPAAASPLRGISQGNPLRR